MIPAAGGRKMTHEVMMHKTPRWLSLGLTLFALHASPALAEPDGQPTVQQAQTDARTPATPSAPDAATIARLQAQIDAMLRPDGLVAPAPGNMAPGAAPEDAPEDEDTTPRDRLQTIASQSNTIARDNVDRPEVQYRAQQVELRAYHALAQDAVAHDRAAEASYRLTQLRNAATQARRSDNRFAEATGDFWLLLADLIDINRNVAGVVERQAKAAAKLEAFLAAHEAAQTPEPIATQVKAALIRLHHQSGANARACALLGELQDDLPADDARLRSLDDAASVCGLIGQAVAVEARTLGGEAWSAASSDKPVLVVFYADWSPQSLSVLASLSASHEALAEAGTRVLAVSVGPTTREPDDQPFPVAESSLAAEGLARRLGVRGLPWLIRLDGAGRVAAVGQTEALLQQALSPPEAPARSEPNQAPGAPVPPDARP